MDAIDTVLGRQSKRRLEREARRCKDGALKTRYLIVLHLAAEVRPMVVAKCLHVSRSTIYEVASRFREHGEAGLVDRREENGDTKLDEAYLAILYETVATSPLDHGWTRSTWTREMLMMTMKQKRRGSRSTSVA